MELFSPSHVQSLSPLGQALSTKIDSKTAVIGIVGLGYVGLPIALEYAQKGYRVKGVDVMDSKVDMLNRGENYIEDLKDEAIAKIVADGFFSASTDFATLKEADIIFIAVPTPFNRYKDPDISYIVNSGQETSKYLNKGDLVILKSTTFPGTTEDYLIPELNKSGLTVGEEYFVAFSPERVDPGNKDFHTGNTPIVVGGIGKESTILASQANHAIIENVYMVENPKIAELEKLLENVFRSVNIALVNELALLCERMEGINIWEVAEAAGTKPFGFMKFFPGPGIGGHCIPVDPYYLSWLARAYDFETRFITLSANINESMPYHVRNKLIHAVSMSPVALPNAKVLILGVAFKKNVKDLRHSPAEKVVELLAEAGLNHIDYTDPWVPEYMGMKSVDLSAEKLQSYDAAVMITDHDLFDVDFLQQNLKVVVDTRNFFKNAKDQSNVVLLGKN